MLWRMQQASAATLTFQAPPYRQWQLQEGTVKDRKEEMGERKRRERSEEEMVMLVKSR